MSRPRNAAPDELFAAARTGDRVALARLLSLVERGGPASRAVAGIAYRSGATAYTIGITGAPGAGKSTLTDRLIAEARARPWPDTDGQGPPPADGAAASVAVLAVDPSSPFTGGAILGDRVRMQSHALDDGVFIRSMATRGHLGGLTLAVPDAVRVLAAAGTPLVLVETVGVGQVEVEVASAADTTVVVVNPGWGDGIQANKAGLLEIADLFVINKADRPGTREARRDLELMLDLTSLGEWRPPIIETVAAAGEGVGALWDALGAHRDHLRERGLLDELRRERLEREFDRVLAARVADRVGELQQQADYSAITSRLVAHEIDPYEAADRLLGGLEPAGTPGDGDAPGSPGA
ncbi:MAG: methylmalonyl Co-A mutase-associated GTPase MeaB [Actinomycetota bacterium]|jgi:LAO/AO transport system kinase|nr:methylmalonyl Co-A mutase-associated GTPase MeaB [Actinomycetota bacterium]